MSHAFVQREHTCDVCGATGLWTDAWSWYGSYLGQEEVGADAGILIFCSDECTKTLDGDEAARLKDKRLKNGLSAKARSYP